MLREGGAVTSAFQVRIWDIFPEGHRLMIVWNLRILLLIESKGLVEAEGAKDLQPNSLDELSEAHRTH